MAGRTGQRPFVGRKAELTTLLERLAAAGRGEGGVVLVSGEPGIGKTRLLAELADRARSAGWLVLAGRAFEAEGAPYLPFSEALRDYVRVCPAADLRAQLGDAAAEVALLTPAVRHRLPDLSPAPPLAPEQERYRLFEGVVDFITAIARAAPGGLLLLDDLHWADEPSLQLLLHLGRRLGGAPVLVVGATRPIDVAGSPRLAQLLVALRREELGERLDLAPLALAEQAALIEAVGGQEPAAAVTAALHERTNGNPFYLQEMVRHLRAEDRDLGDPATATGDWHVPAGVREVIGVRLAGLSTAANRLLQAAAVMGEGIHFDVLGDVAAIEPTALLDAVEEVTAVAILREQRDGYHFSHALIRQAVHDTLSLPRRQSLHRRAAETLERRYARDLTPHLPALARHYRLAGPGATEQALTYAQRAGEAAMLVYAWEAAIQHWQAALALIGLAEATERGELLLRLGDAQDRIGERAAARETFRAANDLARALGAGELLARAALGYAGGWVASGSNSPGIIALLEEALMALGALESALRCRLQARLAFELYYIPDDGRQDALTTEAVAGARRLGDLTALTEALNARHFVLGVLDRLAERLATAEELIEVATAAGDKEMRARGLSWRMWNRLEMGDRAAAERDLAANAALVGDLQQPWLLWRAAMWRTMLALLDGHFADAEACLAEARQLARRSQQPDAPLADARQRQLLYRQRGWLEERAPEPTRAAPEAASTPSVQAAWLLRHLVDLGRNEEAQAGLDRLATDDFAALPRGASRLVSLALLTEVCVVLGERRHAAALYTVLVPFATRTVVPTGAYVCLGATDYYLALLATTLERWPEAEEHFQAAAALHERLGARAFLAQTWFEHGRMLLARGRPGDAERAAELVAQALALAEELGMAPLLQQARELLARSPAQPLSSRALPDGLTAREVEVLGLLAAGLTNKEIAEALVVSERTVENHAANLYGKIGARRRADATAYALRHGLAAPDRPPST